jgi:hypothetical protein
MYISELTGLNNGIDNNKIDPTLKSANLKYEAGSIYLTYTNSSSFTVPVGRSLTYKADTVSLNFQNDDKNIGATPSLEKAANPNAGNSTQPPRDSHFILQGNTGSKVTLIVYNAISVNGVAKSFSIQPGVYSVPSGTDLFYISVASRSAIRKTVPLDRTAKPSGSTSSVVID